MTDEKPMNVRQVAEFLNLGERTVYKWVERGLKCYQPSNKNLFFKKSDILEFLYREEKCQNAKDF